MPRQTLLVSGHNLEAFIEGTRSRTGKLLNPKLGVIKIIVEAFLSGRVSDLYICPISIGYDKVLETESYVNELLGAEKQQETLAQLLNSTRILAVPVFSRSPPFFLTRCSAQAGPHRCAVCKTVFPKRVHGTATRHAQVRQTGSDESRIELFVSGFDPRTNAVDLGIFLKSLAYKYLLGSVLRVSNFAFQCAVRHQFRVAHYAVGPQCGSRSY